MRVVVVGSGPSGVTYARRMQELGHEVTVFEANSEVGGRTRSIEFAGGSHPLGAAFDHHSELEIPFSTGTRKVDLVTESELLALDREGNDITEGFVGMMTGAGEILSESLTNICSFFGREGATSSDYKLASEPETIVGVDTKIESPDEAQVYVGDGWSKAIKEASKDLADLRLNSPVSSILVTEKAAVVTYTAADGAKSTIECEHVHIAVPAAAMKHIKIDGMDEEVREGVDSVLTTKSTRVLFEFPRGAIDSSTLNGKMNALIDSREFGPLIIENQQEYDGTSNSIRVWLQSDGAELGDHILETEGKEALQEKLSSILTEHLKLPEATKAHTHSWQLDSTAEGAWTSHHNRNMRMKTAKIEGRLSLSGDYMGFKCDTKGVCKDYSGTVHGAAISGVSQAERTHAKSLGRVLSEDKSITTPFLMPGASAGEGAWQDRYAESLTEVGLEEFKPKDPNITSDLFAALALPVLALAGFAACRRYCRSRENLRKTAREIGAGARDHTPTITPSKSKHRKRSKSGRGPILG
ncbi:MAG: FAD-dependent oxidoreductase [Rickettsiales bacterium]